jgi:hypothetical protein
MMMMNYISTAVDDDSRGLQVLVKPHVFFKILSYASLEATVALYLALHPDERTTYFRPDYYAKLVRLQCVPPKVKLQLAGEVDFVDYVKFRHLHLHGLAMEKNFLSSTSYAVDAFHSHPMLPPRREVMVVDCLFLPSTAPGRLSNNLVVLGAQGELLCYAPDDFCFRLTSETMLHGMDYQVHSLVSSPLGTRLLVVAERHLCYVKLAEDGLDARMRTRIPERILKFTFAAQCFVDECNFLTMDTYQQHLISKWTYCDDNLTLVRRVWLKTRLPLLGGLDTPQGLVYKRATEDMYDCLIVSARPPGLGQGNRLGLIFDYFGSERPRGHNSAGGLHFYEMAFRSCVIADHVVHPDQKRVYVAVVTRLTKEEFFADVPITLDSEECNLPAPGEIRGVVGIYLINFISREVGVTVKPKFYLDQLGGVTGEEETNYPGVGVYRLYNFSGTRETLVRLQCCRYILTVKLDCSFLAHIPLVSGPESTVCYQRLSQGGHFTRCCFSADHSFGAVFRGYLAMGNDFMTGLRGCPVYNCFSQDKKCAQINLRGKDLLPCRQSVN